MSTTQEAVLPVGSVFAGRYRIKSFLGEGDRKRTYLADDAVFPREVALALIKPDAAQSDPEGRRREAEALAPAGRNDNVVTFQTRGLPRAPNTWPSTTCLAGTCANISRSTQKSGSSCQWKRSCCSGRSHSLPHRRSRGAPSTARPSVHP